MVMVSHIGVMVGEPIVTVATGNGEIALSHTSAAHGFWLDAVTVKFDQAPAAGGNLTVTLDSEAGAAYDVVIATIDPSVAAATDLVIEPSNGSFFCKTGDKITVAYPNPSGRTYGAAIRVRPVY
jgi:hypothetical protein